MPPSMAFPPEPPSRPGLQALSDEDLERRIEELTPGADGQQSPLEQLVAERNRREIVRRDATMVRLTWAIGAMTLISTIFVVLSALGLIG